MTEGVREKFLPAETTDLEGIDVELPIADVLTQPSNYGDAFSNASRITEEIGDLAASRVFRSLATICFPIPNFRFVGEPFTPHFRIGTKVAVVPSDFTSIDVRFLKELLPLIQNQWLKARIIDCIFLKDKSARRLLPTCVQAYLDSASICFETETQEGINCFTRALYYGKKLGIKSQARLEAEARVSVFSEKTLESLKPRYLVGLLRLLLEETIGEPKHNAERAESLAKLLIERAAFAFARAALHMAGVWWGKVGKNDQRERVMLEEARLYEVEAEHHLAENPEYFSLAADILLKGIRPLQQCHENPAEIDRILRRVRELQRTERPRSKAASWEDMPTVTQTMMELIDQTSSNAREFVAGRPWSEALIRLALGCRLANEKEIGDRIEENPLLLLMKQGKPGTYGRTSYWVESPLSKKGDELMAAVRDKTFDYACKTHWLMRASSFIEPCRRQIWDEHRPDLSDWNPLIWGNPVIPPGQAYGFTRGLQAGLTGDWLVSAHILTVKVEAMVRQILEYKGIETATLLEDLSQPTKIWGGLLDQAEERKALPEDLIFEIRGVLLEKGGFNFRNEIAHGLVSDGACHEEVAAITVWWLVLRICVSALDLTEGSGPSHQVIST